MTCLVVFIVLIYVLGALATVAADSFVVGESADWADVLTALVCWMPVAVWMFVDAVRFCPREPDE